MDDLKREDLAGVEWCPPPKHLRYADEGASNFVSLRGSPLIALQDPGIRIIIGETRESEVGGPAVGQRTQQHPQQLDSMSPWKSWNGGFGRQDSHVLARGRNMTWNR